MTDIEKIVEEFLIKKGINLPNLVYLVAFSGGSDSLCLLNALKNITQNRIIAIHLNHNWRGLESDKEQVNCENFCKKMGIEFYSEKLLDNIPQTETFAREKRYEFFENCAKKFKSKIIFTAHNLNDNAETLIYRIAKGTGIKGLQGILPQRDIFYRPILSISKKDINNYCILNNLKPNEDSSNDDIIHKRNLIRKNILPELVSINPSILNSLNNLSQSAIEDTQIINEYLSLITREISINGEYNLRKFLELSNPLKIRILYELISPYVIQNYDRKRILTVFDFIENNKFSKSGKICSITSNIDLFVNDRYFKILPKSIKNDEIIKITEVGEYKFNKKRILIQNFNQNLDINYDKNCVGVDLSCYDFCFELRTRKDGDIIYPLGMSGHQKLKKYFNSRKIPNYKKDELILLTKNNEVLWVAGIGLSNNIKIKTKPTHILKIEEL